MTKTIIYVLVILIFLCIVYRNRLKPFLAGRKAKKQNGTDNTGQYADASVSLPVHFPIDSVPPHDSITCFDLCIVRDDYSLVGDSWCHDLQFRLEQEVNSRLLEYTKRGIVPDVRLVPCARGVIAYFTYRR